MYDVVAMGELLIDFTPVGAAGPGRRPLYEQNPGGAPANVLATLAKLGKRSAFIGMVGQDQFGCYLRDVLQNNNIEVAGLRFSPTVNTTLAFVHLDPGGDRSFSFYRNPGADMMLGEDDVDYALIKSSRIFHFGSISMTDEPARSATLAAVNFAQKNGLLISYDPNYRPLLWKDKQEAIAAMKSVLRFVDVIKVSELELELLTGTSDLEKGSEQLLNSGITLVLVTLGARGCFYRYSGEVGLLNTYDVEVKDTTGAGDAFLGGMLYWLSGVTRAAIARLDNEQIQKMINFANAVGALTTTKTGAIPALPNYDQVMKCMDSIPKTNC